MDFINNEEALAFYRPVEPVYLYPIWSSPFPFLNLPREIRDKIYYYALLEPNDRDTVSSRDDCEVYKTRAKSPKQYWGSEQATRLFRVCHQVSVESLEVFYSRFTFRFQALSNTDSFKMILQRTLTVWVRSLFRKIRISFNVRGNPLAFTLSDEEKWRQTIEIIRQSLPNVREARVSVSFIGFDVPEHQERSVVQRALRLIHPLTDLTGLSLEGWNRETVQRTKLMRDLREALRSERGY